MASLASLVSSESGYPAPQAQLLSWVYRNLAGAGGDVLAGSAAPGAGTTGLQVPGGGGGQPQQQASSSGQQPATESLFTELWNTATGRQGAAQTALNGVIPVSPP